MQDTKGRTMRRRGLSYLVPAGLLAVGLLFHGGCASTGSQPVQTPVTRVDAAPLRESLESLREKGAAEALPQQFIEASRAVDAVQDAVSYEAARRQIAALEGAVVERAGQEFEKAIAAYQALKADLRRVDRASNSGTGCPAAAELLGRLRDLKGEISSTLRSLKEEDLSTAMSVQAQCREAKSLNAGILGEAARCGQLGAEADSVEDLLSAAKKLADGGHYGTAADVLLRILELEPEGENAATARRRLEALAGTQGVLAASARDAIEKCNTERAAAEVGSLEHLLKVLGQKAEQLADRQVSRKLSGLKRDLGKMARRCGGEKPGATKPPVESVEVSAEALRVESLIDSGDLEGAERSLASLADDREKKRLGRRIEARKSLGTATAALDAGRLDEAVDAGARAWELERSDEAASLLVRAYTARAETALAEDRIEDAVRDVQAALGVKSGEPKLRALAARVYSLLGKRSREGGNTPEAIRWYRESLRYLNRGEIRAELARLLASQGRGREAARELDEAIRLGVRVDAATRLQVQVVGPLLAGDMEGAFAALKTISEENGSAARDLMVHALRLPLSRKISEIVARRAGNGGLRRGTNSVIVFAGSRLDVLDASMREAAEQAQVEGAGLSGDQRYMAFSAAGGVVIFDARAGRTAAALEGGNGAGNDAVQKLAWAEVIRAAAPFLARGVEEVLNTKMGREEKMAAIRTKLSEIVAAGLDYALMTDARGGVRVAAGALGEGAADRSLTAESLRAPELRRASFEERHFLEVAAPLRIRGVVQGALRMGLETDLDSLREALRRGR